jgi:hypothetical protein
MSKTFSTAFTSTYNLTDPDTTFTSSASVIPIGYATPAVYGAAGTAWTVTNAGQLKSGGSANGFGVELLGGGAVTNLSTGIIQAYKAVVLGAPGNVVNAGLIRSQNIYSAVALNQGGTLTNTGTIAGGAGTAASLAAGFTNRVVVGAGGVFNGVVNGGNSIGSAFASTLELNSGATQGTLYGLGSQFVNFAQVTIDSGANWAIAGAIGLGASIVDSGILSPVTLVAGAQVTVASGGIILAPGGGTFSAVSLNGAGTLVNFGTINSPSFYSVSATGGGTVINAAGGVIANRFFATGTNPHGATGNTGPGVTLVNSGRVAEAFIRAANISVTNTSAGTIAGDGVGLVLGTTVGTAYLLNAGVITGSFLAVSGGYATAGSGATVTNQSSGTIGGTGSYFGVRFSGNGTIVNAGTIGGSKVGISIGGSGSVTIQAGGTVFGSRYAVQFTNTVNSYTRLAIDPARSISGKVKGGRLSTLELMSAASAGTLTGLGSQYVSFFTTTIDSGATWTIGGTALIANRGQRLVNSGTLKIAGTLNTYSNVTAGSNGIQFVSGSTSRLIAHAGAAFSGTIDGGGGTLELATGYYPAKLYALATQLTNFANVTVDSGANWKIFGTIPNAAPLIDAGLLRDGVTLGTGARLTVALSGTVANSFGSAIAGAGTVFDAGTIAGATYGVQFASGFANRLILAPGGTVFGTVSGGNTIGATASSTLELASGASAGTLSGLGSHYLNFGNIAVDSGANWALSGSNTIGVGVILTAINATLTNVGTLVNNGGIVVTGGIATNTGLIAGAGVGLQFRNNGFLSNSGSIQSSNSYGVDFYGNRSVATRGTIVNSASGSIGGSVGVRGRYGSTTVDNSGSIGGSTAAVVLNNFQTNRVIDRAGAVFGGTVNGGNSGTYLYLSTLELGTGSGTGTIGGIGSSFTGFGNLTVDAGASWALTGSNNFSGGRVSVAGTLGSGLVVTGGIATNTGLIAGAGVGLQFRNNGSLSNSGSIQSSNFFGVDFYGNLDTRGTSGTIVNSASGSIGGSVGVRGRYGSTTVDNSGSIGGSSAAVLLNAGQTNRVIDRAGAVFGGTVNGGNSGTYLYLSTLELASAAGTGTIAGLGSQFTGFGNIAVDSGANWVLSGSNTIGVGVTLTAINATLTSFGTLVNNGGIVLDPSTLVVGNLLGTGSVTIQSGSTLEVTGTIASTETIVFQGANAYLHLDSPNNAYGFVNGFDNTDRIDLKGINPISVYYSAGKLNFITGAATRSAFPLSTVSNNPVQSSRSADGANVAALCFLPDTLIQTPSGPVKVQDLQTGDIVTTFAGAERPIAWIGTGAVLATRGKRGPATPVIIRKSAFAANVPNRDLRVTKGHSFLFDNVLIPAEFLVNHRTIEWDDRAQEVVLYHVELESHDILIANGAPAESYRDDGNRWLFRNANTGWDQPAKEPCAAVLTGGPIVDAAWRRLLDRAGPRPGLPLTEDSDLHLLLDGVRTDATAHSGNRYRFRLPKRPSTVVIFSRAAAPQELGLSRDPRLLGVAIQHLLVSKGPKRAAMDAHDHRLAEGFHGFEPKLGLRWTDGCAVVPTALFDGFDGPMEVELRVAATAHYPDEEHAAA